MKNYEIKKIENIGEYLFVIFSTSYVSPVEKIMDIEHELKSHCKGMVLFDLLLSNGISSNRFMEAYFDGKHFNLSSFKTLKQVDICIKEKTIEYYRANTLLLENSILPNAYQYLIINGKMM